MEEKINLLYAEDSEESALLVCDLLNARGFQVEIAGDGDIAWEMFQKKQPDMVLLDIDMPGKNGWELIRAFKKENQWIPVVLYSAHYDSKKLYEALGVGAEDFLSKTCHPEELSDRLLAFYARAMDRKEKAKNFKISDKITFDMCTGTLTTGEGRVVLKRNESKLLELLCLRINREAKKKYLCMGIWDIYNDIKKNALKTCVTNLRKALSADPAVQITNKRWGGYCLINQSEK